MPTQLPFFGRETELKILHDALRAATDPATRTPQIVTFVAETGVGKSRIIQEFYRQLTVSETWDKGNFWPNDFQSHATQLRVNPEFPTDYAPDGPPRFLWLGMRWTNTQDRNVANSLALPTLKEQVLKFSQRVKQFQSRWQRALEELIASGKEIASTKELLKIVAGNLVPFADVAISLFERSANTVLGREGPQPTLPEQLQELFLAWFARTDTPIILWLDDAQWIDAEATAFFTELMRTARTKRWPILLIATSWPAEWNQFDDAFFLKQTHHITHLSNAADAELRALLHAAFPQLPHDQVALIVHKAGGNFLTMIENISELHNKASYFVDGSSTKPLSPKGVTNIQKWESNRQQRIAQRFNDFDNAVQNFLARASQTGLNTQFLQRVLMRCRDIYPDEAHVLELLHRCQASLAVIMPATIHLHEFRDRGYFAVAQQHFVDWLADNDTNFIHDALVAELTDRVQSAFDADGNLCDPQTHPTSLRAAPSREQFLILDLALRIITPNTPVHVRALVAMVARSAAENAWAEVRMLVQAPSDAAATDHFAVIDWATHAGSSVSWGALIPFTDTLRDAGAIVQAGVLYMHRLNYRRAQHATHNTLDTLRDLSVSLNNVGRIHQVNGDLTTALQAFAESLTIARQLVADRGTPGDLRELSVSLNYVGQTHQANGDLTTALQYFSEDLTISRQLASSRGTPEDLRDISIALNNVGQIHQANGDLAAARACATEALTVARQARQRAPHIFSDNDMAYLERRVQELA